MFYVAFNLSFSNILSRLEVTVLCKDLLGRLERKKYQCDKYNAGLVVHHYTSNTFCSYKDQLVCNFVHNHVHLCKDHLFSLQQKFPWVELSKTLWCSTLRLTKRSLLSWHLLKMSRLTTFWGFWYASSLLIFPSSHISRKHYYSKVVKPDFDLIKLKNPTAQ